jgi:hypothetical protein
MTIDQLLQSLTLSDAAEYYEITDKQCWIEYTFLDPNDLSRRFANRVEDALVNLYVEMELAIHRAERQQQRRGEECLAGCYEY